jgi:preprotein translocase SecE subunit
MVFGIYKRGQGKYTRLCSAFAAAAIVVIGCWRLYTLLLAADYGLWLQTMVPAGLLVVLCLLIFWLVNISSVADFMIAAESEMKKVSWSSRAEIAVSTFVVIIVVVGMAALLGATDFVFQLLIMWLM